MSPTSEIIETPLSRDALAARYRELCDDPRYATVQGKFEIDFWGRITMSPANNLHGALQSRLSQRLLGVSGQAIVEASVLTRLGLTVADVAWASANFMRIHGTETPFNQAPELCVEIASPSNSRKDLLEKMSAYLAAGSTEAWIVLPQTKRFEFYGTAGPIDRTSFPVDLEGFFD